MTKNKTAFVCNDCGADYNKWAGQCTACGGWNTLSEVRLGSSKKNSTPTRRNGFAGSAGGGIQTLDQIALQEQARLQTGSAELDRVLGGGLVAGSAVLIGGNPGAGKSTLLLQLLCQLAATQTCLYVTGEESLQQVAMRARRLGLPVDKLHTLSETSIESLLSAAESLSPAVMVVDSIQVMHWPELASAPGSVSQVRECAALLTRFAKQTGTALILVGHVTKDGSLAGPKVLEHMIDASIMLDSTDDSRY
ncbi:MAG TPA: ATPase domain-containing protein, partial [Pseudomonadales bacterium]|nr:ATPase domain-containing protein [Pseudomonadales bacterium]